MHRPRATAEEGFRVAAGPVNQSLCVHAAELRDLFSRAGDQRRVVPLPAEGDGAHVGAVRLQQQPVRGDGFCHCNRDARVFERDRAAEADVHAELQNFPHRLHAAGKAVHHAGRLPFFQEGEGVAVRVAVVDDYGQPARVRQGNLLFKHGPLHFSRRVFRKMVVEADFPDRHHFRLREQSAEPRFPVRRKVGDLFGVDAGGGEKIRVFFCQRNRPARRREVRPAVDHTAHAPLRQSGQQAFAVGVEGRVVVVRVAVENIGVRHGLSPFARGFHRALKIGKR